MVQVLVGTEKSHQHSCSTMLFQLTYTGADLSISGHPGIIKITWLLIITWINDLWFQGNAEKNTSPQVVCPVLLYILYCMAWEVLWMCSLFIWLAPASKSPLLCAMLSTQ